MEMNYFICCNNILLSIHINLIWYNHCKPLSYLYRIRFEHTTFLVYYALYLPMGSGHIFLYYIIRSIGTTTTDRVGVKIFSPIYTALYKKIKIVKQKRKKKHLGSLLRATPYIRFAIRLVVNIFHIPPQPA